MEDLPVYTHSKSDLRANSCGLCPSSPLFALKNVKFHDGRRIVLPSRRMPVWPQGRDDGSYCFRAAYPGARGSRFQFDEYPDFTIMVSSAVAWRKGIF